ncbi:MAG: sodium:solute symporter family protein [Planctomycetes bacterium]|nr:sodium:solute symporter family protein [Planctomycetota bacterium]
MAPPHATGYTRNVLFVLFLYVAVQLGIGVWASRRIRNEDDYLVAGRSLGPILASTSIFATWFGAESCTGAAGSIYTDGLNLGSVEPFAYGLCLVVMGLVFASRFWRSRVTTLADLFHDRYGRSTERLAAVLLIPTSLLWAGAQIRAFGHVLHVNSDDLLSENVGIAIAAIVAVIYTGSGGLLADVITDVVQGVALVLGLLALLCGAIWHLGGFAPTAEALANARIGFTPGRTPPAMDLIEQWAVVLVGSVVAQEVVSRSLAARSAGTARAAGLVGGGLYVLIGLIPVTLGLLGPTLLPDLTDPEQLLPRLAGQHLPWWINAMFAGALVSAILSTVDSCLLVASSVLTRNLLFSNAAPRSDRARLWAVRIGVAACGVIAWWLALAVADVSDLVEQASGFGSAGIFLIVTLALFSRRGGALAANLCLLAGGITWVLGRYVLAPTDDQTPVSIPHPYLTSLGAAAVGLLIGLLLERRRNRGTHDGPSNARG